MDFGEALAEIAGVERKIHFFAMDLPHSDACFVQAYPAETAEAFCNGHNAAFAFFGKVPRSILCDNTALAVARILGDGVRQRTQIGSSFSFRLQREKSDLLAEIADLRNAIDADERRADWTDFEELRERALLLGVIHRLERDVDWTSLAELRERARLVKVMQENETETPAAKTSSRHRPPWFGHRSSRPSSC